MTNSPPSPDADDVVIGFDQLGLAPAVLAAIKEVGYETPTPIQLAAIGPLLEGRDLLGQAQTGTGKTAAFALPLLSRLDLNIAQPQLLVLAPTRELAIQVAEAMQTYARHMKGFHVLPVYGGQGMDSQLRQLRRGVHAVVGTPGRIQDHLRRGTLKLDKLRSVVIDEADEMLRMGFIDDVEEILKHMPEEKQVALFSATLPDRVQKIARAHLTDPVEIKIKTKTATVAAITQRYVEVSGADKLSAMTRILEIEDFDAMLIFVRTRMATTELAEKLEARGFESAALSGEMTQAMRERTVQRLKSGKLDIVVATDVAARGLDVERISHVVNYDIPHDVEGYIHRIGRTGRAGRKGHAILFVTPRERHMLGVIERATRQKIEAMHPPSRADVADKRAAQFKERITEIIGTQDLAFFNKLIESYEVEHDKPAREIAAALAYLAQKDRPLLPPPVEKRERPERSEGRSAIESEGRSERPPRRGMRPRDGEDGPPRRAPRSLDDRPPRRPERSLDAGDRPPRRAPEQPDRPPPKGMVRYRIAVGHDHGVQPGNIVGAIANEAEISSEHIGRINIYDAYTTVDLPEGMPSETFKQLQKAWVCGQKLGIRVESGGGGAEHAERDEPPAKPQPKKVLSLGDKRNKLAKREKSGKPPPKKHGKGPIRPKHK